MCLVTIWDDCTARTKEDSKYQTTFLFDYFPLTCHLYNVLIDFDDFFLLIPTSFSFHKIFKSLGLGGDMKFMAQHLCRHHLDWNLLCRVYLISVNAPVAITVHPAVCTSAHSEYRSPSITNEVSLYCAVLHQYVLCMQDIPLVCMKKFHSYPHLSPHHH